MKFVVKKRRVLGEIRGQEKKSVKVVLKTPWDSLFRGVLLVTLPLQLRKQWRLRAAAQRRPSELVSAFTLHRSCTIFEEGEWGALKAAPKYQKPTQKLNKN